MSSIAPDGETDRSWWARIKPDERRAVMWATAWFFFILLGYMIVRPVRETMGSIGGTRQLQGLMLATFAVMLVAVPAYGWLVATLPRRWLVRAVYHFFSVCLIAFCISMQVPVEAWQVWTARVFFVWVNVFALFATSVFWSVLADLFTSEQGKRIFGLVAAGGTAGAITGSLLASQLAAVLPTSLLVVLPVATIQAGLWCAWRLEKQSSKFLVATADARPTAAQPSDSKTGGGLLSGITAVISSPYLASVCLFLVLGQSCGTQLYFQQAEIVDQAFESKEDRVALFAYLDLGTQVLTLAVQSLASSVILRRLGVSVALVILPIVYFLSFAALAYWPTLAVLVVTMIATRATGYGITVPTREVLFTVVSRQDKYKSKSFIDTVVLRGGDAASSQIVGTLRGWQIPMNVLNVWMLPITVLWFAAGWMLGQRQKQKAANRLIDADSNARQSEAPERPQGEPT